MKQCELCDRAARMYCEADQASLCWECDANVHGTNFLVARHSRSLLCRICQAPTGWRAQGARLGPTVSVCDRCVDASAGDDDDGMARENERRDVGCGDGEEDEEEDEDDGDDEEEEGDDDDDDEEEEEEEDGEIQVVPWKMTPPPVASSSSCQGEESVRNGNARCAKRMRENADLAASQDDLACPSSHQSCHGPTPAGTTMEDEASSFPGAVRSFNDRKRFAPPRSAPTQLAASDASAAALFDVSVHGDRRSENRRSLWLFSPSDLKN